MALWIALFRGINVGGKNIVPMAALRECMEDLGFSEVRSYIQSGNVVFQTSGGKQATRIAQIRQGFERTFGFEPVVVLLSAAELENALAKNPFPEAEEDPKSLHLFFLGKRAPRANLDALKALQSGREAFHLEGLVFYLYAPDGVGRSKLAAKAEAYLGVPTTARNLRSCREILKLAEKPS